MGVGLHGLPAKGMDLQSLLNIKNIDSNVPHLPVHHYSPYTDPSTPSSQLSYNPSTPSHLTWFMSSMSYHTWQIGLSTADPLSLHLAQTPFHVSLYTPACKLLFCPQSYYLASCPLSQSCITLTRVSQL